MERCRLTQETWRTSPALLYATGSALLPEVSGVFSLMVCNGLLSTRTLIMAVGMVK